MVVTELCTGSWPLVMPDKQARAVLPHRNYLDQQLRNMFCKRAVCQVDEAHSAAYGPTARAAPNTSSPVRN